jgi:trigger factor
VNTELENTDDVTGIPAKQRLDLSVDVRETSACERHVVVTIPRADIDRYFDQKFDELVPQAEVPGFRAGKAPRKLVESRFRPHVKDQVKGALLLDSLAQITDDQLFSAISEPDFDFELIDVPEQGPMTFEFNIEVRPEFDLPAWKGLKLKQTEHEIPAELIESTIQRLLRKSRDLVPVDEPARPGDFVVCNIRSSIGDRELATGQEQLIEVQDELVFADGTIKDFGKLMKGVSAGDSRATAVRITSDDAAEDLRDKDVSVSFEVLDVKRPDRTEIGSLVTAMGARDEADLREQISRRLESQNRYRNHQEVREQITRTLTQAANWQLPQPLLRRQSRREMERAVMELRSSGFSDSEIAMQENLLRQNVLRRTESLLKEHFILEKIAESESIEANDRDVDLEIALIAAQHEDSPRRVRARLERNGQMDALRNMIVEKKVIGLIEQHADISVVKEKPKKEPGVSSLDFSLAGRTDADIPVAKYEDSPELKLPAKNQERS